jgi:sulfopyruvate decarboxylase subunit beta
LHCRTEKCWCRIGRQHVAVALQSADSGQFGSQKFERVRFDNQVYSGTRISEPTATAGKTDLAMMARGAGIEHAVTVASLPEFRAEMEAGLNGEGLKFVVCKVEESVRHREILPTDLDPLENKYQFVRYLERTEGRAIFRGRG